MLGLKGSPVVGVGCHFHPEGTTEHGCDCAYGEGDRGGEVFHPIDAEIDNGPHDYDEDGHDLVFCEDEGGGPLFNDGANGNGVERVEQLLLLLLAGLGEFAVDLAELAVVVEGPKEADHA